MNRFIRFIRYHLIDKWGFIYLKVDVQDFKPISIKSKGISFRIANDQDYDQIALDIFPSLDINSSEIKQFKSNHDFIFLGIKNNTIIHYFLTYLNPNDSPLCTGTPFYREFIQKDDVYLGSTFTIPSERGNWIAPSSLSFIIDYYKSNFNIKRMLVIVHKDTIGAVEYYQRLGFSIIPNASPKNFIYWLLNKIRI